jgi:hypothetical protein
MTPGPIVTSRDGSLDRVSARYPLHILASVKDARSLPHLLARRILMSAMHMKYRPLQTGAVKICACTMMRHPEHQSHFTKPKSELRQERTDPNS